jgi:hypothetical protein
MRAAPLPLLRGQTRRRSDRRRARGGLVGRTAVSLGMAGSLLVGSPSYYAAQESPATGVLTGTIVGEDSRALSGAEIAVVGSALRALTARDGTFRLPPIPSGLATVEVGMLGYQTTTFTIEVVAGRTLTLDLQLEVDAVRLDPLHVSGRSRLSPEMRGFYERRDRGGGHFITRAEIDETRSQLVTDVLRRVPGVRIERMGGPFGSTQVVQMGRARGISGTTICPVLYYMNGSPLSVPTELGINHFVRANEIDAMEIYDGASRVPSRFHSSNRGARCGVIVIWTHAGEYMPRS